MLLKNWKRKLPPPISCICSNGWIHSGFTLAEILIALAILGIIATFTIPKVLQANQDGKYRSMAKEAMSIVSGSYESYKLNNSLTSNVKPADLTPYINYVSIDSTSLIDAANGLTSIDCSSGQICMKLHNGAILRGSIESFGGTDITNAIIFGFDPDGIYGNSTSGSSKALSIFLYYNGRVATWGTISDNTTDSNGSTYFPDPARDPTWFSWN